MALLDAVWVPIVAVSDLLIRPWRGQSPELWKRARRGARVAAVGLMAVAIAMVGAWYCGNPVAKVAAAMVAAPAIISTAVSAMNRDRSRWIFGAGLAVIALVGLTVPAIYLVRLAWGTPTVRPNLEQSAIYFISFSLLLYAIVLRALRQEPEY